MDIILGFFVAAFFLALCVGFGVAVSSVVTGLLGASNGDDREPPERR